MISPENFRKYVNILPIIWDFLISQYQNSITKGQKLQGLQVLQASAKIGLKLRRILTAGLRPK